MFLSYKHLTDGPGPSEAIIAVNTHQGVEEVIVDRTILENGHIDVGHSLGKRKGETLVELPRESVSGQMRVWVPDQDVTERAAA